MALDIKIAGDPIEFTVPDADGTKIAFDVPPMDYLPRDVLTKYRAWVRKNNRLATEDEANLKLLELILDKPVYELIAGYPPAVARQITETMAEKSKAKLGESSASTNS